MATTTITPGDSSRPVTSTDAAAFVAVLVTGMCLIFIGHITPAAFSLYVGGLISLYSAWRAR